MLSVISEIDQQGRQWKANFVDHMKSFQKVHIPDVFFTVHVFLASLTWHFPQNAVLTAQYFFKSLKLRTNMLWVFPSII